MVFVNGELVWAGRHVDGRKRPAACSRRSTDPSKLLTTRPTT